MVGILDCGWHMPHVIIVDMRENNGQITGIMDGDWGLKQFPTEGEAEEFMGRHILGEFPWLVVEI